MDLNPTTRIANSSSVCLSRKSGAALPFGRVGTFCTLSTTERVNIGQKPDFTFWSRVLRGSHGLSARRARRTKSSRPEGPKAGPKGHRLEVGARRAREGP